MVFGEKELQMLLHQLLDLGEMMLQAGAEINRVEDTLTRMGAAYGALKMNVFVITSSIVVTMVFPQNLEITQTRRISSYDTNMDKVAQLNALSRYICENQPDLAEIRQRIREIRLRPRYPETVMYPCCAVIAAAFTLFYGGGPADAAAAAIAALVMRVFLQLGQRIRMQTFILNLFTSAVTGLAIVLLVNLGLGHSVQSITIGCVMLLIPGLALTTSFRDMISGDIISGMLGFVEALLRAMAIALGFAFVLLQMGG